MKKLDIFYIVTIIVCIFIACYVLFFNGKNKEWIGQTVTCDYFDIQNKVVGQITYEEGDFIVVSGYNEVWLGMTGQEQDIVYHDCEGCSSGVKRAELVGWSDIYEKQYSDSLVMKKYECIRVSYKEKDLVNRIKIISE